jgi:uncharacterized membrane protein
MYPVHPATVHLPIGLLIGNAILTVLYLRRGDQTLETAAYHCLWLGLLLVVPAILAGTFDAARQLVGTANPRNDALGWINAHAISGFAVLIVYWQAWQIRRRNPAILSDTQARRGYLARLALGVILLLISGWIGGHMVYVLRLGVAPG